MKTEKELREKIEEVARLRDKNFLEGDRKSMEVDCAWIEALKWVLEDSEEKEDEN